MRRDGEWLKQKLAQSGFTLEDLANQSGLPLGQLEKIARNEEGTDEEWNEILSVLNTIRHCICLRQTCSMKFRARFKAAPRRIPVRFITE